MSKSKTKRVSQLKVSTQLKAGFNLSQLQSKLEQLAIEVGDAAQQNQLGNIRIMIGDDVV